MWCYVCLFVGRGGRRVRNGRGEDGAERGAQISPAHLPEERSLPRPKGLQRVGRLRLRCTYSYWHNYYYVVLRRSGSLL